MGQSATYSHRRRLANSPGMAWAFCLSLLLIASVSADELDEVVLQLPWYHQFQFAGYYAAEMQGFYADAGMEVDIRPGFGDDMPPSSPVEDVVFDRAEFGVGRSELLIHYARGLPVTVIANIFQRSPLVFVSLEEYGIERLEDIGNQPVSLTIPTGVPGEVLSVETLIALDRAGVDPDTLNNDVSYWQVDNLINGDTRLLPGFSTDEPYQIRAQGHTPILISPQDYDVDFYGDMLFTNSYQIEDHPERVEAFRNASIAGWRYAMENPEAVADYILEHYTTRGPSYDRDFLLYEAEQMQDYIQADLIEVGYSNPRRWARIANLYTELGLIEPTTMESFLYRSDADDGLTLRDLMPGISAAVLFLALIGGIAAWLHTTNRRLKLEITRRESAEATLRTQAEKDALTDLDNRHQFHHRINAAVKEARQTGQPLCLIMLDVDYFKDINDQHGHLFGDTILKEIARVSAEQIRETDHISRYGGEEFAFILADTPLSEARQIAERVAEANRAHEAQHNGTTVRYTISAGVAALRDDDLTVEDLINRADQHLYLAKEQGRDRIATD